MRGALVERRRGQSGEHADDAMRRIVGELRIGGVALHAVHGEVPLRLPRRPILIMSPRRVGDGRLADDAGIEHLAVRLQPVEHLARAVDRHAFLVAGDEEADRAAEIAAALGEKARRGRGEAGDRALHVGRAAAVEPAVADRAGEGIDRPGLRLPGGTTSVWPAKQKLRPLVPSLRIEIEHRIAAGLGELDGVTGEAQAFERRRKHAMAPSSLGVTLGARISRGGELRRVERGAHQSRNSSLIEVLARVFSSTRLTMTAQ